MKAGHELNLGRNATACLSSILVVVRKGGEERPMSANGVMKSGMRRE